MKKTHYNKWIDRWMQSQSVPLWGAADIRELCFRIGEEQEPYPSAVSWAIPMPPDIMEGIKRSDPSICPSLH
jgi:hypothetical protein